MSEVASRELRNCTRDLIRRAEAGEEIVITVNGRAAAMLVPVPSRPRWMSREEFIRRVVPFQADAELAVALREAFPETTDDLPDPYGDRRDS